MKYPINVVPLNDCVPLVVDSSQKNSFIFLCLKPEMWQKVAKFKGAEYFRKALYVNLDTIVDFTVSLQNKSMTLTVMQMNTNSIIMP